MQPDEPAATKKRALLRRALNGVKWVGSAPIRAFPGSEVAAGASYVRSLINGLRNGPERDARFRVNEDNTFDLQATAFYRGISVWQLEKLLERRQRETAKEAYLYFGAGWFLFLVWLILSVIEPWTSWRIISFLESLPFFLFLFLIAFQSALQNFRIRTRRLATPIEYLATKDAFWPR